MNDFFRTFKFECSRFLNFFSISFSRVDIKDFIYDSMSVRFTIKILNSYSPHIGSATNDSVKMSDVGLIMAATTRITTIACLRYFYLNFFSSHAIFCPRFFMLATASASFIASPGRRP